MSEFEFLSVLVSIIFGLGLTHALSGLFRMAYLRELTERRVLYTIWVFMVLVLNWWVFYGWRDYTAWSFEVFLLIVLWALSFYVLAITLYPPEGTTRASGTAWSEYRGFHVAVAATVMLDIAWTALKGNLFTPWYYLPFVLHYVVLGYLAEVVRSHTFRRAVAWWYLLSIVAWALVVRRYVN
jgi:hypothetical protein